MSNYLPARPLTVTVIDDCDLARAGLQVLLAPFGARVRLVAEQEAAADPAAVDVVLYEPATPVVATRLDPLSAAGATVAYSWAPPERTEAPDGVVRLPKSLTAAQLVVALEEVVGGRHPGLVVRPRPPAPPPVEVVPDPEVASLTNREHEVLTFIARGMPNREIAARLGLSLNSVKTYIRTAYRKVGVERRTQAVLWGLEHGLADDTAEGVAAPAG